ncbi:MAG: hypothetical protein SynsKO_14960 [Synoicihabitans sp.]
MSASLISAQEIAALERDLKLPDFSYAGYHRSEHAIPHVEGPLFNVLDYGARPNDGKSDRESIQQAVDAAGQAGGGVVFLPAGRYDLIQKNNAMPLYVRDSRVVIRGEGSGEKGTVLYLGEMLPPPLPLKLWGSPYVLQIGGKAPETRIAPITADVARGGRRVSVADTKGLRAGDWIILELKDSDPELLAEELAGFEVIDKRWTQIRREGVMVTEHHQIESISEHVLTLTTPVIKPIDHRRKWHVVKWEPWEELGLEKLRMEGDWQEEFVHHRSWQDDGGFSMVKMSGVVNSWIRDCAFVNVNRAGSIQNSAHVTVIDSVISGRQGHSAISFAGSSFGLMARVQDLASMWHSLGVSKTAMGNVLWRCYWGSQTSFESHSSQPRHTLIDSCVGAFKSGHAGGAASSLPNHLEGLVLWNHLKTNEALVDFRFEPLEETYWRILQPTIVGMHGSHIDFRAGQSTVISLGKPIFEGSLYEFQVRRRLGDLPTDLR